MITRYNIGDVIDCINVIQPMDSQLLKMLQDLETIKPKLPGKTYRAIKRYLKFTHDSITHYRKLFDQEDLEQLREAIRSHEEHKGPGKKTDECVIITL